MQLGQKEALFSRRGKARRAPRGQKAYSDLEINNLGKQKAHQNRFEDVPFVMTRKLFPVESEAIRPVFYEKL